MNTRAKGISLAVLCCVTYTFAYLCRINLSSAAEKMAEGFGTSVSALGIFGTVQAFVYAAGQLINGYLVNRYKPRLVLLTAVVGSACANLLMGITNDFFPALIIWTINAWFQSLFWVSIVAIIGIYPESRSDTAAMWLIIVVAIGYFISWTVIAGFLDSVDSWHPYFWIPGGLMLLLTPVWAAIQKICPETDFHQGKSDTRNLKEIIAYIQAHHVTAYCIITMIAGMIREGVLFWAPVLLARILSGSKISPYLLVSLIPLCRIPSSVTLRLIPPKVRNAPVMYTMIFGSVFILCLVLLISGASGYLSFLLITLLTFLSMMLGSLTTAFLPMTYAADGMSAPIAGLLDALTYLGGSISTLIMGHVLVSNDLTGAAAFWICAAAFGILTTTLMRKK